jgi:energy-coupling factor transport system ATP-binding protein
VLKDGEVVFDGKKEELFEHSNFNTFHLDMPTPIKIMKHLAKTADIKYQPIYDYQTLLSYLKEAGHE